MRKTKKAALGVAVSFDEDLKEDLQTPRDSAEFLSLCLRESKATFLLGIKKVAEVHDGLSKLARKTGLNRENLYDALSLGGNPRYDTLVTILKGLGLGILVVALDADGKPEMPHVAGTVATTTLAPPASYVASRGDFNYYIDATSVYYRADPSALLRTGGDVVWGVMIPNVILPPRSERGQQIPVQ